MPCRAVLPLLPLFANGQPQQVHFIGIPPGQASSHLMGTYTLRPGALVNGRPSYLRDAATGLWYADGAWCAGRVEFIGERRGSLVALDLSRSPERVSVPWSAFNGIEKKMSSSTAKCVSGDAGASTAASEAQQLEHSLSQSAKTVFITATKMDKVRKAFCGAYNVQRRGLVNQRQVYLREGSVTNGKSVTNSTKMIWQVFCDCVATLTVHP